MTAARKLERGQPVTRRHALLASAAGAGLSLLPQSALANTDELAAAIAAFAGGAPVQPGKVRLDVATLVDNGNTVPLTVTVDSPMTPAEHVSEVAIFNEKNPQRDVVRFAFGPLSAKATASTRIRLATTQKLVAVARMNDGSHWSHTVDVIVTLAACIETET